MASFGSVVGWIFGVLAVMIIGILIWNVLIPMFSTNFAQNCDNLSLGDLIAQRLKTWECECEASGGINNWDEKQKNFLTRIFKPGIQEYAPRCGDSEAVAAAGRVVQDAAQKYDFYEIMEVMIEDVDDLPPSNVVSNDISNFIYTAFQKHLMDHHNMQV